VKEKPDLSGVPAKVRRLLERCREKDPKKRLRDIGDMGLLLAEATAPASPAAPPPSSKLPWIAAVAVAVLAAGVLGFELWRATQPAERPLVRLDVDLGADVSLPTTGNSDNLGASNVAISPDGMRLAYASGNPTKLFTRRLDQSKVTEIAGTQGGIRTVLLARRTVDRIQGQLLPTGQSLGGRRRGSPAGRPRHRPPPRPREIPRRRITSSSSKISSTSAGHGK
jgi:hypothetical protein